MRVHKINSTGTVYEYSTFQVHSNVVAKRKENQRNHKIVRNVAQFSKHMYRRQRMIRWVSDFTRRCGDGARSTTGRSTCPQSAVHRWGPQLPLRSQWLAQPVGRGSSSSPTCGAAGTCRTRRRGSLPESALPSRSAAHEQLLLNVLQTVYKWMNRDMGRTIE